MTKKEKIAAKLEARRIAMEAYAEEVNQEVEAWRETKRLLSEFFKNEQKVNLWLYTKNPMLGDIEPVRLFVCGRAKKLLQCVKDMLDGNMA